MSRALLLALLAAGCGGPDPAAAPDTTATPAAADLAGVWEFTRVVIPGTGELDRTLAPRVLDGEEVEARIARSWLALERRDDGALDYLIAFAVAGEDGWLEVGGSDGQLILLGDGRIELRQRTDDRGSKLEIHRLTWSAGQMSLERTDDPQTPPVPGDPDVMDFVRSPEATAAAAAEDRLSGAWQIVLMDAAEASGSLTLDRRRRYETTAAELGAGGRWLTTGPEEVVFFPEGDGAPHAFTVEWVTDGELLLTAAGASPCTLRLRRPAD